MSTTPPRRDVNAASEEPAAELTLLEVSRFCAVQTGFVIEMIEEGALAPLGGSVPESWRFSAVQTHLVMVAARLQRDLGVNLAGAALALQLLDEMETLRAQITATATASGAGRDADRA